MSYNKWETWKNWEERADRWTRHRDEESIADVDQSFIDNYIDGGMEAWTISGVRSREHGASNLFNRQGELIDKNNWDGWTLQSASLIGDRKGLYGPGGFQHKYLTTAWTQDQSKTVYIGLHHWGSLDQDGGNIPDGTHVKSLGYFKPTDKSYEGIESLFNFDFNGDQIVDGKAWKEPKPNIGATRPGQMVNPVITPHLAPSRPLYDELELFGLESTGMNSSLDDEPARMVNLGAPLEPIPAVESMF